MALLCCWNRNTFSYFFWSWTSLSEVVLAKPSGTGSPGLTAAVPTTTRKSCGDKNFPSLQIRISKQTQSADTQSFVALFLQFCIWDCWLSSSYLKEFLPVQWQRMLYRGLTLSAGSCLLLVALKSEVLTAFYLSFCKINTKPYPGFISINDVGFFSSIFGWIIWRIIMKYS